MESTVGHEVRETTMVQASRPILDTIMADDYLYAGEDEAHSSHGSDADAEHSVAENEAFFQAMCLKMHRAELEVYRQARQHGLDRIDVLRFIASVLIPSNYHSKSCSNSSSNVHDVPGVLIQYLRGFPIRSLYADTSPPAP